MKSKATKEKANTNANATTNAQAQQQAQAQDAQSVEVVNAEENNVEEANKITATITKVMLPQGTDERITFVLDKEFTTIDFATGEEKTTNMFGLNIYAVVNQVGQYVPEIQLADTLAMGKCVNPQIIALALTNAEIVVKREEHEQGEKRKNSNELYARDCITSEIVKVKTNIKPIFSQMLMQVVTTAPAIVKAAAIPNPFGM